MSGHGDFSVIGGMAMPPAFDLSKVDDLNLERPKVDGLAIDDQQAEPLKTNSRLEQANRIISTLDILLAKAAKTASSAVDATTLKISVDASQLDKSTRKEINRAAENADKAFKVISLFTGKQFAAALKTDHDNLVDWDMNNPAGKAIAEALDAMAALSEKLREALNKLPPNASAATQSDLEEAMLKTDRRACEVETLVCEFADMAAKAGNDPEVAARLDRTLKSLLPDQSLKMHGSEKIAADFRASLAPLAKRIENLAEKNEFRLADKEVAKIRLQIGEAKNALANAWQSYADKCIHLDGSLMASLDGLVNVFEARLNRIRGVAAVESMRNFVNKTFSPPDIPIMQPKLRPMLAKLLPHLCAAMDIQKMLKDAALAFINNPSWENRLRMHQLAEQLAGCSKAVETDLKMIATDKIKEGMLLSNFAYEEHRDFMPLFGKFPADLRADFAKAMESFSADNKERERGAVKAMFSVIDGVTTQTDRLYQTQCSLDANDPKKFMTNKTVEAAFVGKIAVTTLVETRLNGLPDEDADPALDGSNVESSKPLGSGAANTVHQLNYKDGSTKVFKPEAAGRQGVYKLQLAKGAYSGSQLVASLNMAAQKTADAFGLNDVMAKSSVGVYDGRFGLFMEKVPGKTAFEFALDGQPKKPGSLTSEQIKALPDEKYSKVVGQIMRKLNRLEWFDLLTGQGDRHHNNYMLNVDEDSNVSIKAIDNDACFGKFMIGPGLFVLKGPHANKFMQAIGEVKTKLYPSGATSEQSDRIDADPGIRIRNDNSLLVNTSLFKSPELNYCIKVATGCHVTRSPTAIDQELYDKLVAMKSGEARNRYIADLKARLDESQVEIAVQRLDSAIRLAEALKQKGRVIASEAWETKDTQRMVAGRGPAHLAKVSGCDPLAADSNKIVGKIHKYVAQTTVSIFRRDLMSSIAKPGWFNS